MPLLLLVAAAWALAPPAAEGAPLTLYGVQLPDPLHVYALQEAKPENIRNDPFLVVFKTHIPSLRPYEIPYFPPKDYLSAEEVPAPTAAPDEQPTPAADAAPDGPDGAPDADAPASDAAAGARPDVDLERLPELVELKPEALLEALDASKQDLEEKQTTPETAL
ncbi:hypothetical protein R5R35_013747 [Gryllus longicercus]|uniref:Accessory gland protein n=1 Tax=Gryllus longicercus TaxID=2509291 RepID=A0AAN9W725_9ORTH